MERQRDNPEDMFTLEQNLARNKQWAKPGVYNTPLSRDEEFQFRDWLRQNNVPFDPTAQFSDYDMRGFWRGQQLGDPRAVTSVNPNDGRVHYPDYWKTPYDATFSDQSQWAIPGQTPQWKGNFYMYPNGAVIYDDQQGRWYGAR